MRDTGSIYKPVPVENMNGQSLATCPLCRGSGRLYVARKTMRNAAGEPVEEKRTPASANSANALKRNGWTVTQGTCERCHGAGMVVGG